MRNSWRNLREAYFRESTIARITFTWNLIYRWEEIILNFWSPGFNMRPHSTMSVAPRRVELAETKYSRMSGSCRISLQPSPRCLRRTAIVPPRPRIPDGRYPPCGIPLDAPFGGCNHLHICRPWSGAFRKGQPNSIIELWHAGPTGGRSLLSGRIGKNKEGIRAVKTARGLRAARRGEREIKRQFLSLTSLGVAECSDTLCVCVCTYVRIRA